MVYADHMKHFMTEKQIETYLETETRMLPLPEGGEQVMTGSKLMWEAVDFIIDTYSYNMDELITFTRRTMCEKNYDFSDAFQSVVSYIYQSIMRKSD